MNVGRCARLLIALVASVLAGCATPSVRVEAPAVDSPLVTPLPLRVGLRIAPAVREHALEDTALGIRYLVAEATTSTFLAAVRATFSIVVELQDATAAPPDIDAVIELAGVSWSRSGGTNSAADPGYSAEATVTLDDARGSRVASWTHTGRTSQPEILRDPDGSWLQGMGLPVVDDSEPTRLIENLGASFLRDFRDAPGVREWLEARHAYRPALPALAPGTPPLAPPSTARNGVHVTSDVASDAMRRCTIEGLRKRLSRRHVVTGPGLRHALYPWLSDRPAVPTAIERIVRLLYWDTARARLDALDVGTVILVTGSTAQDWHGNVWCGAGYGGGGCLGVAWGDRRSVLVARVLDLEHPEEEMAQLAATHSGHAVVPAFGLPLPFIPATQSAACEEVARALAEQLESSPGTDSPRH